ncbi:MAG: HK97 gp10 family phage protein [Acidimicrobiia bacterium]|nr:MAG: HK97 gp10 family phage protein [Acidimicrobiia bacterium]
MARWSIPLDRFAEQKKDDLRDVVRKITFDVFRRVVLRSPVDTGRFRANWNVTFGAPSYTTSASTEQGRGLNEAAKALTLPVGGVCWLSNGLPYAQRLEYGWSKQAPAGMVRVTVAEFDSIVAAGAQRQ